MKRQKKMILSIILCGFVMFLFFGCQRKHPSSDDKTSVVTAPSTTVYESAKPEGLSFPIKELSDPFFFDQEPAVFQTFFPRPVSAVYLHDGVQDEISADDPKLNRLMNLIEYSWTNGKTIWLQGLVPEEEIEEWLNQKQPVLVIHFSQGNEPEGIDPVKQILICGAECLIEYPEQNGTRMIEDHWPCAQYLRDMKEADSITEDEYTRYMEYAKEEPWLDLITYSGF